MGSLRNLPKVVTLDLSLERSGKAERCSEGISNRGKLGVGTSLESLGDSKELVLRKYCGSDDHAHFLLSTLSFGEYSTCLPMVACELGRASKQKLIYPKIHIARI